MNAPTMPNPRIIVPSSIFTNSYFYKHEIEDGNGNESWPTLTFYGDDSSADNTTAHVSGVIYGNITGDDLESLLTELSKNTTGTVTYDYTTDDPYQINLPSDVLKLVPFSQYASISKAANSNLRVLIENSPTQTLKGTSSKGVHNSVNGWGDFLKGIVNAAVEVGTVAWDFAVMAAQSAKNIVCSAITAIATTAGEFLTQLGKAIIDFGKEVIGTFKDKISEVKAAVEKVVDVIGAIIEWVKEAIINAVMSVVNPIKARLDAFYDTLIQTISDAFTEYSNTGRLSAETQQNLNSVLNFNYLYVAFGAMVIAIDAIAIAAGSVTLGAGYLLISAAVPLIIMAVVVAFSGSSEYETAEISGLQPNLDLNYILNFVRDMLTKSKGNGIGNQLMGADPMDVLFGFVSVLFGMWSWITGAIATIDIEGAGAVASVVLGAISWWVFGIAALIATGTSAGDILGLMAIIGGILSLIGSGLSLRGVEIEVGTKIALGLSLAFGGIGIYTGYESLSFT